MILNESPNFLLPENYPYSMLCDEDEYVSKDAILIVQKPKSQK